jgi:hypothetical protein
MLHLNAEPAYKVRIIRYALYLAATSIGLIILFTANRGTLHENRRSHCRWGIISDVVTPYSTKIPDGLLKGRSWGGCRLLESCKLLQSRKHA